MDEESEEKISLFVKCIPEHVTILSENLYHLQQEGSFCDVALLGEDGDVKCHSVILAALSPYFKQCISHSKRKFNEKFSLTSIYLTGEKIEDLQTLVKLIYTGSLILSTSNINRIMKLLYTVDMMSTINYLQQNIIPFNKSFTDMYVPELKTEKDLTPHLSVLPDLNHQCFNEKVDKNNVTEASNRFSSADQSDVYDDDIDDGDGGSADGCGKSGNGSTGFSWITIEGIRDHRTTDGEMGKIISSKLGKRPISSELKDDSVSLNENILYSINKMETFEVNKTSVDFQDHGFVPNENEEKFIIKQNLSDFENERKLEETNQLFATVGYCSSDTGQNDKTDQTMALGSRQQPKQTPTRKRNSKASDMIKKLKITKLHGEMKSDDDVVKCNDVKNTAKFSKKKQPILLPKNVDSDESFYNHVKQNEKTIEDRKMTTGKTCRTCNEKFDSVEAHDIHRLEVHQFYSRKTTQTCSYEGCTYKSRRKGYMERHKDLVHGESIDLTKVKVFQCTFEGCNYYHVQSTNLKSHIRDAHTTEKTFTCEVCGKAFKRKSTLKQHESFHIPVKDRNYQFSCEHCNNKFSCKGSLMSHIKRRHQGRKFLCHLCPFSSNEGTSKTLDIHLFKAHNVPLPSKIETYHCTECDYYTFYKVVLASHMSKHAGESFICDICGKVFGSQMNLNAHRNRQHNAEKKKCPHEGCQFEGSSEGLRKHIRTMHVLKHIKPFACHLCEYRCNLQGNLTKHLRGKHKMEVETRDTLWHKLRETGQGYDEIFVRSCNALSATSDPQQEHS